MLLAFVSAIGTADAEATRAALGDAVGDDGLLEAAATVAIFNGLVRVADGTGIQLDAGLDEASAATRAELGIDRYGGAANTPTADATADGAADDVAALFGLRSG